MRCLVLLSLVAALFAVPVRASAAGAGVLYRGGDGAGAGKSIVLVSGDEEYRSEEALPQLGRILSVRHGFTCRVLFAVDPASGVIDPDARTSLPGLETLDDADLLVIATRFRDLPDDSMAHIDAYVRSGRPVVGLRTATHAFALEGSDTFRRYSWNYDGEDFPQGFGRQVLGETWIAHHGRHGVESTRGIVAPGAATHAIVRGIAEGSIWGPSDVYRVRLPLPDGCTPIVLGQILAGMVPEAAAVADDRNDPMMPVAWTRTRVTPGGSQRVFTTTMGAATDLEATGTRRLIVHGAFWALGMEDAIPREGANVDLVGAYRPTPFGFGGFRRGVRPADHALPVTPEGSAATPERDARRVTLENGARIMVVGNTFAERLAASGVLDAVVHAAHPGQQIAVRHVPWSGDEVGQRPREHDVPTMEDWIERFDADLLLLCFGMSESFSAAGVATFEADLRALVASLRSSAGAAGRPPRLVLVTPIAHESLGGAGPDASAVAAHNAALATITDAMRRVARVDEIRLIDLYAFSRAAFAASDGPLTTNGIHPDSRGCAVFAGAMARALGWAGEPSGRVPGDAEAEAADALLRLARDKHAQERLRYRPTNTEYVWGRRKTPYGVVNFPPEMEQLDRMIAARERAMSEGPAPTPEVVLARAAATPFRWSPSDVPPALPEDAWTPVPVEAKGTETSLGRLDIDDPAAFTASFEVAADYVVECFASEQDFPELANPLAMAFDDRGRLWVLCTPTYPHLLPGTAPRCTLLILEDETGDGRADRCTVFADGLYIPTGFALDAGVVYVGQAPDLLRFVDTDGDDRADVREVVLSGFGMCDSHHQISAFEWDPSGGLLLHEGVFTKSNVETPYGTRRTDGAGVWRYDPRTGRLDVLAHCYFNNPWGHAFDDFGGSILSDASDGNNYAFSQVALPFGYPHKPGKGPALLHRGRPTAGCEIVTSRHFPDDVQGSYLVNQSIGFHGTRWDRVAESGSAWSATAMPEDLLASSDTNFRPVAMEIGPDGALYVVDWCNPIVGHMQYSVRDPRRDHTHGRVWRIRHRDRPLVTPPDVHDASIGALLRLLRLPEGNTRQLARRRLQRAGWGVVRPTLTRWSAALDPVDPLYDRLVLEDLWIRDAYGRASVDLVERALSLGAPRARAAAVRMLRRQLQAGVVEPRAAAALMTRAVEDADMRVRLEGVVASGFLPPNVGVAIAARADLYEMDDAMHAVFGEVLSYLGRGGDVVSDVLERVRLERLAADELLARPLTELTATVRLARNDLSRDRHVEAIRHLAGDDATAQSDRLVRLLVSARGDDAVYAAGRMLLSMPEDARARVVIETDALIDDDDPARRAVGAALRLSRPVADDRALDAALVVSALAMMDAGVAPAPALAQIRAAVDADLVDPAPAIAEIVRHAGDETTVRAWLARTAEAVAGIGLEPWQPAHERAMPALRALAQLDSGDATRVRPADPALLEAGRALYHDQIAGCVRCHGVRGQGLEGFPPLDRSPWVLGDPRRAASIVIHGLYGEIRMSDGRVFDSVMEPLGDNLDDAQVAAVLTYVRQSWGNFAGAVTTAQVAEARAAPAGPREARMLLADYPLWRDTVVPAAVTPVAAWPVWLARQVVVYLVPPLALAAAILWLLLRSSRPAAVS